MTAARDRAKGNVHAPGVERQAYSVREFAAAVGISIDSVYRCMKRGELKSFKIASEYRIPASEITRLLAEAEGQVAS